MISNNSNRSAAPESSVLRPKQDIGDRFSERAQAQRYRDRFLTGRRQATHAREVAALETLLQSLGQVPIALDVACGPGRFVETLTKYSTRLIQTDLSRHMLDLTREDHPLPDDRGGYFQADAQRIPLCDQAVDLLFCHRFLNHLPDPLQRREIILEMARVTRHYLIISCLGLPRVVEVLRQTYRYLKGRSRLEEGISMSELLTTTAAAGLVLVKQTPIRRFIASANYLTFVKSDKQ
ncbi:MAG: class I SAM-dependent methyltransferase [Phycisphaerae bacterium]